MATWINDKALDDIRKVDELDDVLEGCPVRFQKCWTRSPAKIDCLAHTWRQRGTSDDRRRAAW